MNMRKIIFVLSTLFLILSLSKQTFAEGIYSNIGTAHSSSGSADAVTWSEGNPITIDKYGHYISVIQIKDDGYFFTVSNDKGATWLEIAVSADIFRPSLVYDSKNDKLHVISSAVYQGIRYRRYTITRDAENKITDIAPDGAFTVLSLDSDSSGTCNSDLDGENPIALWKDNGSNGILVAFWAIKKTCGASSITETRASMITLSNSSADGVAGNWHALNGVSDASGAVGPADVAYNKLY
jgi:hypothetical protein